MNWLNTFFSKKIARKIKADKNLIKLLLHGTDLYGEILVFKNNFDIGFYINEAQKLGAFSFRMGDIVLIFFAISLYCNVSSDLVNNYCNHLKDNKIIYGQASGELLIGHLHKNPIIVGKALTEATKQLHIFDKEN